MATFAPTLSKNQFIKILSNPEITQNDGLQILQTIYSFPNHEAAASDISKHLQYSAVGPINSKIAAFGLRVAKHLEIDRRVRTDGSVSNWDIFFTGYYSGSHFIWVMKKELIEALEELKLVDTNYIIPFNTYLFVWNPNKWEWDYIEDSIEEIRTKGHTIERWSCGNTKSIRPGDRAFLMKVSTEPKGIVASGTITTYPYKGEQLKTEPDAKSFIQISFDNILNPDKDIPLTIETLLKNGLVKQKWTPQASGISIQSEYVESLEYLWFNHINELGHLSSDSKEQESRHYEGDASQILQTKYERNRIARTICLEKHGYNCAVCSINFEKKYGAIGKNYIHIHHIIPISQIGDRYAVNPEEDLIPVCPNCHAMLHKKRPTPYTTEELKKIINNA